MSDNKGTKFFTYSDLYYAAQTMREYAKGELTKPNQWILDRDYFMAIADKLQAACEIQGACERAEGRW